MTLPRLLLSLVMSAVAANALAAAPTAAQLDDARARGLAWLVTNQQGDGSFAGSKGLAVQATAAAVEAMLAGGLTRSPQYARALSWLGNAPPGSIDAQAWQTMTLAVAGRDSSQPAGAIRDERNVLTVMNGGFYSGIAVWGPFAGYTASVVDTALGYGALRAAGLSYTNDTAEFTSTVECRLLPAQLASAPWSGSWPYALPQTNQPSAVASGSLLATASLLYELKKSRQANRLSTTTYYCGNQPSAVDTAMANAKTWLIAQANPDGGFAERNPQSGALEASNFSATALSMRALALFAAEGDSAATTAVGNAQGWLVGQQGANGGWGSDPFVAARVLASLPAASGAQLADSDLDGLTDVVEQKLGTQTLTADAQGQVNNGANSVAGITATSFNAAGTVNVAFSYNLAAAAGGGGPYTYTLASGVLPPGLALAGNGTISGTPTTPGSFAFDYQVTDAGGAQTVVIGRVDIASQAPDNDTDVPMPGWALVVMAAGLLAVVRRRAAQISLP